MDEFKTQTHINLQRPAGGSSILRGSLAKAATSLRRQLWLAPLFTAAALAMGGMWLYRTVEASLQKKLAGELEVLLNADLAALDLWLNVQQDVAADRAANPELVAAVETLLAYNAKQPTGFDLTNSPEQRKVRTLLDSSLKNKNFNGYILVASDGRVVSAFRDELTGKQAERLYEDRDFLAKTLSGQTTVSRPMPSAALLPDRHGRLRAGVPTMFACAPILNSQAKTVAALCFRLPPDEEFSKIIDVARFGYSGDTYAFDRNGLLLTSSRFDPELKRIGLLPDTADAASILQLTLRDPVANLTRGERAPAGTEKPLMPIVAEAIARRNGVSVTGSRDLRGVSVVGAWKWLPDYGMGVATQVDYDEAYETLSFLRYTLWGIFGLLIVVSLGLMAAMLYASRMNYALKVAAVEAARLGQYVLEKKLGEGGMGVVYQAKHAMLRRPTAVKLLQPSASSEDAIRRFEREVQLTSQLTHPNTIAIYDYGRTPEGIFYYAMEYLDGINLDALVQRHGPLPEGRVIELLTQVCGSLAEAHDQGLIHRDIKPANILLNQRGRQFDLIKVLDFGLVKSLDGGGDAALTHARTILGTPHFMSPEAILTPNLVDARSDLYAVGAVGYFLLTGKLVFEGRSIMEVCNQHLNGEPIPPSQRLGKPISADLERIILSCLDKRTDERPADAETLAEDLRQCLAAGTWTRAAAAQWWRQHYTPAPCYQASADFDTDKLPENDLRTVNVPA